jgi:16S rRNA processing protein RimM
MNIDDVLLIGRIARTHGIRGHVIVNPETDFLEDRFQVGRALIVGPPERGQTRAILEVRVHQGRPILHLEGIETMDDAEKLAGLDVWLPAASLAPLPDGTFYRHDLVGCEIRDLRDRLLGRVAGVEGTLDRSYLVLESGPMIPLVAHICLRVEPAARRIVVDPPAGLLEINAKPETGPSV